MYTIILIVKLTHAIDLTCGGITANALDENVQEIHVILTLTTFW